MGAWMSMDILPRYDEEEPNRPVLVWHRYQGAVLAGALTLRQNRYNAAWMEIPDEWIDMRERRPTKEDADQYGCVLVRHRNGDIRIQSYNPRLWSERYECWMRLPERPAGEGTRTGK